MIKRPLAVACVSASIPSSSLCVFFELCVKPDLLFVVFRAFRGQGLGFSGRKMGRVGPVSAPFVLQKGPVRAMMDPQKGRKPPQKLIFAEKQWDKRKKES